MPYFCHGMSDSISPDRSRPPSLSEATSEHDSSEARYYLCGPLVRSTFNLVEIDEKSIFELAYMDKLMKHTHMVVFDLQNPLGDANSCTKTNCNAIASKIKCSNKQDQQMHMQL